jgi:hypothetical protein
MSTKSWSVLREDDGKVSAARVILVMAMGAWVVMFGFWCAAVGGLFFDLWPWARFKDAITVGGAGLIGTLVLTIGGYAINRMTRRAQS